MPKIKTSTGSLHYKSKVIYWGVKKINKQIASKNLSIFKAVLDNEGIPFMLIAGTLLGATREHDFITHDEDIDIAFLSEDKQRFFDTLPKLIEVGFEIARYDRRELLSVIRNGEYIDCSFFKPREPGIRTCSGSLIFDKFLLHSTKLDFKGESYNVPQEYIEYLKYEYGPNWGTPISYFNFKRPWLRIKLFATKEHIKDILPQWIFNIFVKRSEQKIEADYRSRIERYFTNGGSAD